jgi:hypothetical protein
MKGILDMGFFYLIDLEEATPDSVNALERDLREIGRCMKSTTIDRNLAVCVLSKDHRGGCGQERYMTRIDNEVSISRHMGLS